MHEYLQGILLGLGVAIPIGPINILIMSYAINSYSKALMLGIGAMCADAIFLLLSSFGIARIIHMPIIFYSIAILGSLFLLYMAWGLYRNAKHKISVKPITEDRHIIILIKGLILNLLNPYLIMFCLGISANIAGISNKFGITLTGLICGILLWITLFPLFIHINRKLINDKVAMYLAYISAAILVIISISMIYKIFTNSISI